MKRILNFNKLIIICCLFDVGLSNFSTAIARERMGGVNGGGGNFIEALFKTKALELSESLLHLSDKNKTQLGFDTAELYTSLVETGGFFTLCAKGDELTQLKNEHKMAMVFNDMPGRVYLNCSDYTNKDWENALDLSKASSAIFVLHESLRIMDFDGENNYGYSKNYLKIKQALPFAEAPHKESQIYAVPLPFNIFPELGSLKINNGIATFAIAVEDSYVPRENAKGKLIVTIEVHSCSKGLISGCAIFEKDEKIEPNISQVVQPGRGGVSFEFPAGRGRLYWVRFWARAVNNPLYLNNIVMGQENVFPME